MGAMRALPPESAPLVQSVVRRTREKGIAGDWAGQASKLYAQSVQPALQRQLDLLQSWRPGAVHDAGCWRLKDGEAYYAVSLKNATTTGVTPDEVHKTGLDLVASLSARPTRS